MKITCWGSRGSIPVSGKEYLKYGGDTTCLEIRSKNGKTIIIDAGSGIRRLGSKLVEDDRFDFDLLFTHAHWDHLMGLPFFKPIYFKKTNLRLHGCPFSQKSVEGMVTLALRPPYFPIRFEEITAQIVFNEVCNNSMRLDTIDVTPIHLSHPNQGLGYRFAEDGKSFVFLTDNELAHKHPGGLDFEDYRKAASGADILLHDSEFTDEEYKVRKTWGHSVYTDALRLAMEAGVKRFGLFHHNQDRSDQALDGMVEDCRRIIKEKGSKLECFAVAAGTEIEL